MLSLMSLFLLIAILINIMKVLKNAQNKPSLLDSEDFQIKFGVLFEDLNLNSFNKIPLYWNGLYLLRWTLTVCILIFLKD